MSSNKKYYKKNNNYNKNNNYYKKNKKNYYYMNKNNVNKNNIDYNVNNNHGDVNINKEDNDYTIDNEIIENNFEVVLKKKEKKEFSLDDIQKDLYTLSKTENLGVDINKEDLKDEEDVEIKKKPKKNLLIKTNFGYALGIIILLLALVGTTYSYFNYTKESRQADIASGDIYVKVVEDTVNLTGKLYPSTKEEARSKSDNVVTFTVKGINTSEKTLYYEVKLNYGDSKNSPYLRFNDSDLVFDLIEVNGSTETYVVNAKSFNDISTGSRIWADNIPANTTTEVTKTYKLRMWLSDKVTIDDDNGTYPASTYKNYYASIKASVFGDFTEKEISTAFNKIKKLKDNGATYIASYDDIIAANPTFTTQDQVSSSATKQTVYYFTGSDALENGNLLFAGYCWQIVRTTDNGGVRILYNGVAVNDKCETDRTATKGVNASGNGTTQSLSSTTTYGTGYTYDVDNSTFTLTGIMTGKAWSSDYADLIGTYTCLGTDTTCSTLISINGYSNSTTAYVAKYTIGDVAHYSQLGTSPFNANYRSPAMVGYMFNKVRNYAGSSAAPEGSIYGKDIEYNNGSYLVIEDTEHVASANTTKDANHHYTCGTAGTTSCTTVRFYYYNNYYITLENGETVESILKDMINYKQNSSEEDANINNYNSTIKGYLDNWYNQNLNNTTYTQYLDDTAVYCNNRSVSNLGSWNKSSTNLTTYLQFKQYSDNRDLNCENETDRFSVTNTKAELTYPVGLLTEPERNLMVTAYAKTGQVYWGLSPSYFSSNAYVRFVYTTGDSSFNSSYVARGARAALTLRPGTEIEEGSGTYTDPYVVGPKVTRTY